MFIPIANLNGTAQIAVQDLYDFFDTRYKEGTYLEALTYARNQVISLDKTATAIPNTVCGFTESFLTWLERVPPQNRNALINKEVNLLRFLNTLLDDLRRFAEPKEVTDPRFGERPSRIFMEFVGYTIRSNGYTLAADRPADWDWKSHQRHASWLMVYPPKKEAIILNNEFLIDNSSEEASTVCRRYENIFLHELGHFRTNLRYYETAPVQDNIVFAEPVHETIAWIYAKTVKASISGARARLCRFVGKGDPEWQ